jgi:hypothetical protein
MKIYIVLAEIGRYDDAYTEVLKAFTNEEEARAFEDKEYDSGKYSNVWSEETELQ